MPSLFVDNHPVTVPPGATILEAARAVGIDIPTICFRQSCSPSTSCMVCVVKLRDRANLVPACSMPAEDGMDVQSETPEVHAARRTALELLLSDHAGDCEAPCRFLCPAGMNIPKMLRAIRVGNREAALEVIREDMPLAATLGYVCHRPCEKGCRRAAIDRSVTICDLKRDIAQWGLENRIPASVLPEAPQRTQSVAVVGAGPAGITAAYFLRRFGFQVNIFEKNAQPGGRLLTGFSPQRLPADVLQQELAFALGHGKDPGLQVNIHSPVEDEDMFHDLEEHFDAVVIACPQDFIAKKYIARRKSCATQDEKIFAAGSGIVPQGGGGTKISAGPVVRSVAEGRDAAESVRAMLDGGVPAGRDAFYSIRMGKVLPEEMAPMVQLADTLENGVGKASGGETAACKEAARCLHCDCRAAETCRLREYGRLYKADIKRFHDRASDAARRENRIDIRHPRIIFESGKCVACGLCIRILEQSGNPQAAGMAWFGRGYEVRVGIPFNDPPQEAIEPELLEACVKNCPTAAVSMKE